MKRKTIGAVNPMDLAVPKEGRERVERGKKTRFTTNLGAEEVERLRDVAWWERKTVTDIVREAVAEHIQKLEKKRGKPFPPREGEVKTGRPVGS